MDDAVELAEMIGQLRSELSRAMADGAGEGLRFQAEKLELELTVAVERSREPGAKVRFWVLDVHGSARSAHTATQRIKLTLQPVLGDAPDSPALISGAELPDES
ncbi:trypco2 family protein [Streptomyces sp. CBMA152]|uniref:trypco2 family protein n=1 Tax=Streptomyces sp. CBMA152 TaxID=1896312 RepID=UPI002948C221|nr:trypco2 family protein [Streptomyces sp. CBMA152]